MTSASASAYDRVFGVAMIVAPFLLLLSTIVSVAGDGLGEDEMGGILQVYAAAGFFLAFLALTRILEPRDPRFAALLLVLGTLGAAGAAAYGINSIYAAVGPLDINDSSDGLGGPFALKAPGILFPIAFIGIGILLWRRRVTPAWAGLALVAGGVLFPISRIGSIDALAPVPDILLLFGLASIGWQLFEGRSLGTQAASPSL